MQGEWCPQNCVMQRLWGQSCAADHRGVWASKGPMDRGSGPPTQWGSKRGMQEALNTRVGNFI